jgi:hypothetical protein
MNKKQFFISLAFFVCFLSCKRDKLEEDKELLVGRWSWTHSYYEHNKCEPCCTMYDTLNPQSEIKNFSLEFEYKGKVKFFENGILINEGNIAFDDFYDQNGTSGKTFDIHVDNDANQRLLGTVFDSTLYTWDFPYEANNSPCDDYKNYFLRE